MARRASGWTAGVTTAAVGMASLVGLIGMVGGLAGCESSAPPQGQREGRIPLSQSTSSEARDARVLPADLLEYSDQLAESLIRDLPEVDAFAFAPGKVTILYGDIANKTRNTSSDEFEVVRERMKNNLLQSRTFRERFRFLVDRAQLEQLRAREVYDSATGERFDRDHTYLLNGTMYRIDRGVTNYYYMDFQLVNFNSGEIAWSNRYESKRWTP